VDELGRHLFLGFRKRDPGLDPKKRIGRFDHILVDTFGMGHAVSGGHQIDRTRFDPLVCSKAIAVV